MAKPNANPAASEIAQIAIRAGVNARRSLGLLFTRRFRRVRRTCSVIAEVYPCKQVRMQLPRLCSTMIRSELRLGRMLRAFHDGNFLDGVGHLFSQASAPHVAG